MIFWDGNLKSSYFKIFFQFSIIHLRMTSFFYRLKAPKTIEIPAFIQRVSVTLSPISGLISHIWNPIASYGIEYEALLAFSSYPEVF